MINNLKLNESENFYVIISDIEEKSTKTGVLYKTYTIRDSEGTTVIHRDFKNVISGVNKGDIILATIIKRISGDFTNYDILSFTIPEDTTNLKEMFKLSYVSTDIFLQCVKRVRNEIESINNIKIRDIVKNVYTQLGLYEEDNKIFSTPITGTSAIKNHHVGLYGNLYHTLEVLLLSIRLKETLSPKIQDKVSLDFLKAGALLHDIGKYYTYVGDEDGSFGYTVIGQTLDHLALGIFHLGSVEGDIETKELLSTIIGSHHGKIEWGAIKPPSSLEAWIVHQADMISFVQESYMTELEENLDKETFKFLDGYWINPAKIGEIIK